MYRIIKTINSKWKFKYYPAEKEDNNLSNMNLNDDNWKLISLPHTWNTYENTGELHPFIKSPSELDGSYWWYGFGWYRKKINISSMYESKKIFIEFGAVQKYSKIWINGKPAGEHKGGYNSFYFDISDHIVFDEENVIAVQVSNRRDDDFGGIPPMTAGNFNVYGGIYRDVNLVIKDRLHIPFQGSYKHEGGTFVTTPAVSKKSAKARIKTFVENGYDYPVNCTVETLIVDNEDEVLDEISVTKKIEPGIIDEFDQTSTDILNPVLWCPDNPYLYKIKTYIKKDGDTVDYYESPLGFRWFNWDYEKKCLYLNGERIHLHGTNRHQEYPWLGDAIPKWIHKMDLYDIKYNLEHNFLRTCHYTQDKMVYDLCDKLGIIVCEEVPNIKNIAFSNDIQKQNVKEMIRRDRNNPSIFFWSMGNETDHAADGNWAREEDGTRIIHFRRVIGRGENEPHNHEQMEMENLLRCTVRGWHDNDVKALEPNSGQCCGHEKWQHDQALIEGGSFRGHITTNGAVWLYADHGMDREYMNCPLKHVNPKGWVDAYRIPKLMYYLWQANWAEKPMVYIHPYDWTRKYLGQNRNIVINSNCEQVELFKNGRSQGIKIPDKDNYHTVVYENVLIEEGEIKAEGRTGNKVIHNIVIMPKGDLYFRLESINDRIPADYSGICLIKADITDAYGNHIYGALNDINIDIKGPGSLVSPSVFRTDINKKEEMEGTMYIDTPVYFPVRATNKAGEITVTVWSDIIKKAKVKIESFIPEKDKVPGIIEPEPLDLIYKSEKKASGMNQKKIKDDNIEMFIKDVMDDIDLTKTEKGKYRKRIDEFIKSDNPCLEFDDKAYIYLLDLMEGSLKRDKGYIIADDYNFNIKKFNQYIKIQEFIDKMKLDNTKKTMLKEKYARKIIKEGNIIDFRNEIKNIDTKSS